MISCCFPLIWRKCPPKLLTKHPCHPLSSFSNMVTAFEFFLYCWWRRKKKNISNYFKNQICWIMLECVKTIICVWVWYIDNLGLPNNIITTIFYKNLFSKKTKQFSLYYRFTWRGGCVCVKEGFWNILF